MDVDVDMAGSVSCREGSSQREEALVAWVVASLGWLEASASWAWRRWVFILMRWVRRTVSKQG